MRGVGTRRHRRRRSPLRAEAWQDVEFEVALGFWVAGPRLRRGRHAGLLLL